MTKDPRFVDGVRELKKGEQVVIIGAAEIDPRAAPDATGADRLVIRPWKPPMAWIGPNLVKIGRYRLLAVPDFFLLARGTEARTGGHLTRHRLFWTIGTLAAGAGVTCFALIALIARISPGILKGLLIGI